MFLACLKKNEYDDAPCTPDHSTFLTCMEKEMQHRELAKQHAKEGSLGRAHGDGRLLRVCSRALR